MKTASSLVALVTALTFTSAFAASELTTSGGQPIGSSYSNTISVATPATPAAETAKPAVEQKAPVQKSKKRKAKKAKITK